MENQEGNFKYLAAKKRVEELKGFYWHLAIYVAVNGFIFVHFFMSTLRTGESFWQWTNFLTAVFWGIGLLFHALHTFGWGRFFSKEWENRQIEKYMAEEEKREQFLK
ncbi:2TM domain-containing protein [Galbibacter mesophilus]|uniref:2TM domain-containing protein n=1 Tax=Galbibacter mesophilus TaxID=379069 RepID=UPI00191FB442|nr:2TM domain-containing protein [Galbibacter mesophilus]MCM5663671.1 2TM domain-containing protein [Galbibacter mesophilus]